jgi:hypothetical protein
MNPRQETDLATQRARAWSHHLGRLAAASPATRPGPGFTHPDARPSALTPRLSAALSQLQQRRQRQELVADKVRAQEFIIGP